MKHLIIVCVLFSLSLSVKAQDTIIKRDGAKIVVKLTEVNPDNVRYKKFDYLDGPVFTLQKEEINYLAYSNGTKESFENYVPPVIKGNISPPDLSMQTTGKYYYYKERRISEPDMLAIAGKLKDPKLDLMIKKVEEKRFIQNVSLATSVPLFLSGAYIYEKNRPIRSRRRPPTQSSAKAQAQKNGEYLMLGALACDVVSVSFMFDRRNHAHILVNAYNQYLKLH